MPCLQVHVQPLINHFVAIPAVALAAHHIHEQARPTHIQSESEKGSLYPLPIPSPHPYDMSKKDEHGVRERVTEGSL